jgi:hypothetical protein
MQKEFELSYAGLFREERLQQDEPIDLAGLLRLDEERLGTITRLAIGR